MADCQHCSTKITFTDSNNLSTSYYCKYYHTVGPVHFIKHKLHFGLEVLVSLHHCITEIELLETALKFQMDVAGMENHTHRYCKIALQRLYCLQIKIRKQRAMLLIKDIIIELLYCSSRCFHNFYNSKYFRKRSSKRNVCIYIDLFSNLLFTVCCSLVQLKIKLLVKDPYVD